MVPQIKIQVLIKEDTEVGIFNDAIYFTQDEYSKIKQSDLDDLINSRKNKWVDLIKNPADEILLTKEEAQAIKLDLEKQLTDIDIKINSFS